MQDFELKGKVDVSLYGVRIPAALVHEDGVTTSAEEKTMEIPTMDGTMTVATGIFDNVNSAFTLVLPNMDFLKNVMPDLYEEGTHARGRIAIGGSNCSVRTNTPLVVHYTCQENSDNDVFIPNASVSATFELNQNANDPVTVQFTANAMPSNDPAHNGAKMFLGTGSLTEKTLWDAEAEAYEPVAA